MCERYFMSRNSPADAIRLKRIIENLLFTLTTIKAQINTIEVNLEDIPMDSLGMDMAGNQRQEPIDIDDIERFLTSLETSLESLLQGSINAQRELMKDMESGSISRLIHNSDKSITGTSDSEISDDFNPEDPDL